MKKANLLFLVTCFTINAPGQASGKTGNDSMPGEISIMNYNIKMLPRGATFLHHHPVQRARLIPDKLLAEGADMIVFEESFDGKAIRILKKGLKAVYPYIMGEQNRRLITYKRAGGVLIFSKYPLHEIESIAYTECKGADCMGHKGAMLVEVEHPVHKFQLLGTHIQAGSSANIKLSQYKEAGELLKRHEEHGVPQFAAGDFNTDKANPQLYPALLKALNVEDGDISGELQFTSDHKFNDMGKYNPNKRKVIDYVFFKGNGIKPANTRRYVKAFEQRWSPLHKSLSDHNAIILRMKL